MASVKKLNRNSYVDQAECTGCEACVITAPKVFRMTPTGLSEAFDPQGSPESLIQEAMDGCPVSCIHWGTPA
ncbi:MAG TPA: ferredoxin [bacterium]|nr:ferredoxin [bacterium]